jgi:hypothetical protein
MTASTEDLINEIKQLRAELKQMQSIVNSLVNIVIDMEGLDEDYELAVPEHLENYPMYN